MAGTPARARASFRTGATAPGSIMAAIIDAHGTRKDANEPSPVATPRSMPLICRMATIQQGAASPSVAANAVAVVAVVGSFVARAGAGVGGASMPLPLGGLEAAVGANGAATGHDREAVEVEAPT